MARDIYLNCKISGCRPPGGEKTVRFDRRAKEWYFNRQAFMLDPPSAIKSLAEQGLFLGGQAYGAKVLEEVRALKSFALTDLLIQPGWSGAVFARADGKVFVPQVAEALGKPPGIGFYRHPARQTRVGKLSVFKEEVSPTLLNDDDATFIACMVLVPVIRSLISQHVYPFAVEIIAGGDRGTLRTVVEKMIGSMNRRYFMGDPVRDVLADPARFVEASNDSLLLLGDIGDYLCGVADRKRVAAARTMLFDHLLPSGDGENNSAGRPAPMFMLFEGKPIVDTLGLDGVATERLRRTVLQIDMAPPPGNERFRRSDWAKATHVMGSCYGVALYAFQSRLVQRREKIGLQKLTAELDRRFDQFCAHARRTFDAQQLPDRLVHPFALVYTAFRMAEQLRVLPETGRAPPAIWRVFTRYMAGQPAPVTAETILMEVATRPDVLVVNDLDKSFTRDRLEDVPAFIKVMSDGSRELWVVTDRKMVTFDWPTFSKLPDFEQWYRGKREKSRYGSKTVIGGWNPRVIRFRLPC